MVSKSRKRRKQKQQYYRQVNKVDEKYQKVEEKYQTEAAEEQSDTQIDQDDVVESTSSWNQRKDKVNAQQRFKLVLQQEVKRFLLASLLQAICYLVIS